MINLNYTAEEYDPHATFVLVPEGNYKALIDEITEETAGINSKHPGVKYIRLKFRITEGPQKGKHINDNIHINNPNEQTRGIAKKQLDGIAYALSMKNINNSNDIINKPMQIKVAIENEKWNKVKKYYKYSETVNEEPKKPGISLQPSRTPHAQIPQQGGVLSGSTPIEDDEFPF